MTFHRFFSQRSLVNYHTSNRLDLLLTTCLFLASKVEEQPRRLRDVINSIYFVRALARLAPETLTHTQEEGNERERIIEAEAILKLDGQYWDLKEKLVDTEQLVLRVLGFDIDTFEPYRLLLNFARSLRARPVLVEVAWTLVNDALFSSRCQLECAPAAQAVAALYVGQQILLMKGKEKNEGEGEGRSRREKEEEEEEEREMKVDRAMWIVLGAAPGEVEICCQEMLDLYEEGLLPPPPSLAPSSSLPSQQKEESTSTAAATNDSKRPKTK